MYSTAISKAMFGGLHGDGSQPSSAVFNGLCVLTVLDRIRPRKREQVQFLFPSLALHRIAECVLCGSVDATRGEEGADSSNMICIFETYLPFDSACCSCTTAKTGK
jgi:hypothetical protein